MAYVEGRPHASDTQTNGCRLDLRPQHHEAAFARGARGAHGSASSIGDLKAARNICLARGTTFMSPISASRRRWSPTAPGSRAPARFWAHAVHVAGAGWKARWSTIAATSTRYGLIFLRRCSPGFCVYWRPKFQLMYQRVHEQPSARKCHPGPASVSLAHLPEMPGERAANRYQNAGEILADLEFKHALHITRTVQIPCQSSPEAWLISASVFRLFVAGLLALPPVRDFLFRTILEPTSGIPSSERGKFVRRAAHAHSLANQSSLNYVAEA